MVVDDSAVVRGLMGRIIDAEPDMHVVCSAANGRDALDLLRHREIDVLLLDIEMPEMDGVTALPRIVREHPGVRVVMASALTQNGAEVTLRCLGLGAADYVTKPSTASVLQSTAAMSQALVAKVRALGRGRAAAPATFSPTVPTAIPVTPPRPAPAARQPLRAALEPVRILVVASSTGGPNALVGLLGRLPTELSFPVLIAQHMPPIFTAALADRLTRETGRPCAEARDGEPALAGRVYVAPGDHHMTVRAGVGGTPHIHLDQGPPENFCRPAADPLLRSAAGLFGGATLAVVLTGMGEDGLRGCREVAARGGRIFVQDQASSVVWGMPGAVHNAGLAHATLPLEGIAGRIGAIAGVRT
jgi:two-component system, chemotaxis family, protein-glutamate methylesterase/glutaminase